MEQPVCQEKTSSFGLLETEDEPADVADAEDVAVEDVQADLPAKGSKQKGGPDKKGRKVSYLPFFRSYKKELLVQWSLSQLIVALYHEHHFLDFQHSNKTGPAYRAALSS